jgi:hypothetical protein
MGINIFKFKIEFLSSLGYVEMVIDNDVFVVSTTKEFIIKEGSKITISPVVSYGAEFDGWVQIPESFSESFYENTKILSGKLKSDTKIFINFRKKESSLINKQVDHTKTNNDEKEIEYGVLKIRNQPGGSFILRTDEISVIENSNNYVEYSIQIGSYVQIAPSPAHDYEFVNFTGDSEWIKEGHGKMPVGQHEIDIVFNKQTEKEEQEIEKNKIILPDKPTPHGRKPRSLLKYLETNTNDEVMSESSERLSFGVSEFNIETINDIKPTLMSVNNSEPIEIILEFKDGHFKWGPWYHVNGNVFHDLVLVRGTTYKFSVIGNKIEGDILDEYANAIDLSSEGGSSVSISTNLHFTPNENTPNELLYKVRIDASSIRDSRVSGSILGKIHIRSNHQYGKLISYGYVENANIAYKINDQNFNVMSEGDSGVYRIGITPNNIIRNMSFSSGTDILSNTSVRIEYMTIDGAMQINAITTLLAMQGRDKRSIHVRQKSLKYALGINFECDLLNDDPIEQILQGNSQYMVMFKKMIIINALMSFIEYINHDITKDNLFGVFTPFYGTSELQLGDPRVIYELLSNLYNAKNIPENLSSVSEVLANLFGWVDNLDTETYLPNWYKLFAFGRTFEQYYIAELEKTLTGDSPNSAIDAWTNFASRIEDATFGILIPEVPEYAIIETGTECDKSNSTLLDTTMKIPLTEEFFKQVTDGKTLHINTLKYMYGNVISTKYGSEYACYKISTFPNEYDPTIPTFSAEITDYSYTNIDACCSELPINIYPDPTPKTNETDIFSLKLVESGDSNVMYEKTITTKNHPIEYLGNDEYRLYLSESVTEGGIAEASPGYCVIPKKYATSMEQRYLKLGYNSETYVKQIFLASLDKTTIDIHFTMMTQRGLMSCYALGETDLSPGDSVSFSNSIDGKIDGEFLVAVVSSNTLFTVFVNMEANESVDDYTALKVKMISFGGTRIYCDVSDLEIGDSVVFDKTANGLTYNIATIGSEQGLGNYFSIDRVIPTDVKRVVKSHVIENEDNVVEFMYTGKTQYYTIAAADSLTERVWLTYDPDTSPLGRTGHTISYVQFFFNESGWEE